MQYSEIFKKDQFKVHVCERRDSIALYLIYFTKISNSISRVILKSYNQAKSRSCISNYIS